MAKKKFSLKDPIIGGLMEKPSPSAQFQEAIKNTIQILPELEYFIRKLNHSEYELLKADIEKNGCKEPLKLWQRADDFVIIDGHHRYAICQELGLDYEVEAFLFDSIEEVKVYMAKLQLGRRNLTVQEISYLRGMQYSYTKGSQGGNNQTNEGKTQDKLGEEYGVSGRTIVTDYHIFRGVEKLPIEEKQVYLMGESFLRKQDLEFLGKEEVDVVDFLNSFEKKSSLKTSVKKEQVQVKKTYFDAFSSRFEKEIQKANHQEKNIYKEKLLQLLSLLEE